MTSDRRVLEVLGRSEGGIARHVGRVVAGLDGKDGLTIDIAGPADLVVPMPKEIVTVDIPHGPVRGHLSAVRDLELLLDAGRYDVVHAHGLRASVDTGLAVRRARIRPRALASVHNVVLAELMGRTRWLIYHPVEPLAVRLNDLVFAASLDIARRLDPASRTGKVEVLHLGVEPPGDRARSRAQIRDELRVPPAGSLVVCVARLSPQKALHILVRAHARLENHVILAVVGDGELRGDLEQLASDLGVAGRTRWLGYRDDAAAIISAADVFCLSSAWEACALAAQEAMHLGVPVVSTAVGGMPELIEDRLSGRLVPPGDPAALAAAIAGVLGSTDEARRYAARALETVTERFSTTVMLDRLEAAYRAA